MENSPAATRDFSKMTDAELDAAISAASTPAPAPAPTFDFDDVAKGMSADESSRAASYPKVAQSMLDRHAKFSSRMATDGGFKLSGDDESDYEYFKWAERRGVFGPDPTFTDYAGAVGKSLWQIVKGGAKLAMLTGKAVVSGDSDAAPAVELAATAVDAARAAKSEYEQLGAGAAVLFSGDNPEVKSAAKYELLKFTTAEQKNHSSWRKALSDRFAEVPVDEDSVEALSEGFDISNLIGAGAGKAVTRAARRAGMGGTEWLDASRKVIGSEALGRAVAKIPVIGTSQKRAILVGQVDLLSVEAQQAYDEVASAQSKLAAARATLAENGVGPGAVMDPLLAAVTKSELAVATSTASYKAAQTQLDGARRAVSEALDLEGRGLLNIAAAGTVDAAGKVTKFTGDTITGGWDATKKFLTGSSDNALADTLAPGIVSQGNVVSRAGRDLSGIAAQIRANGASIPFFRRVAQAEGIGKLTKATAAFADWSHLGFIADKGSELAGASLAGAPVSGAFGYVASGGDTLAAAGSAGGGMAFGISGGAYGQWQSYTDPRFRHEELLANRRQFRDHLAVRPVNGQSQLQVFDKMDPGEQLLLATYAQGHPDVAFRLITDEKGPSGYYDRDNNVVVLNTASKTSVPDIFRHEVAHFIERHGMEAQVRELYLGDAEKGVVGEYTAFGADGKPIIVETPGPDGQVTKSYQLDKKGEELRSQYEAKVRAFDPTFTMSPQYFASELFAEQYADHVVNGGLRRDLSRNAVDSAFEALGSVPLLKGFMGGVGLMFDKNDTVVGTEVFSGLGRNAGVGKLISAWNSEAGKGRRGSGVEEPDAHVFTERELRDPAVAKKWLQGGGAMRFGPDGAPVYNANGTPQFLTEKEAEAAQRDLANELVVAIERHVADNPEDADVMQRRENTDINGKVSVTYSGRKIPASVIDALEAQKRFNPHQLAHLRAMSASVDAHGVGAMIAHFYQAASRKLSGKAYKTTGGRWRRDGVVGFQITKDGNVVINSVSWEQLAESARKAAVTAAARDLYQSSGVDIAAAITADTKTYLENVVAGRPGNEGLGDKRRDFINNLFGIRMASNEDVNPFFATTKSPKPILTSLRLDRINRLAPLDTVEFAWGPAQYRQVKANLRPDAEGQMRPDTRQTDTPEFKAWFGESKVTDESGAPRVVYHGTSANFNKFSRAKATQGIFWFTSNKGSVEAGEVGAQGRGRVIDLFASLKNPAGWDEYDKLSLGELRRDGYDGAILPDKDGQITGFVFEPEQLKSASKNVGTFDPKSADIRMRPDVMPIPERFTGSGQEEGRQSRKVDAPGFFKKFDIDEYTRGGKYFDLSTGEDVTGRTYESGSIDVSSGRPALKASDTQVDAATGGRKIRTNLFKQSAGWKWVGEAPAKTSTLVSVEHGGDHFYTLNSQFDTPVEMARYEDKKSEPRLRPTTRGFLQLGTKVGEIEIRGRAHPVYDRVTTVSDAPGRGIVARGEDFAQFRPDSNAETSAVAENYMKERGIPYVPHTNYDVLPEDRLKQLADHFQDVAKHDPENPEVQRTYQALADETMAQYRAMERAGIKVEPFTGTGEPYKSSAEMMKDVRDNKHLSFFLTDNGFGQGAESKNNPLLQKTGVVLNGRELVVNDLFRVVHDYFGHTQQGFEFGPRGEFNAWKSHSRMFGPEAQGALAAETLAQNAWVNFGPHLRDANGAVPKKGEQGYIPPQNRPFGEQKNFIVPQEFLQLRPDSEGALRAIDSAGDKKATQVDPKGLRYPENPVAGSVALVPRWGLVNRDIVGMPRSHAEVDTIVTRAVDRLKRVVADHPEFAKESAAFYKDMGESSLIMADAVEPGISGRDKYLLAELQLRNLALGSPRTNVTGNATKSSGSASAHASGHESGVKLGFGPQQRGAKETHEAWKRGEHFNIDAEGIDDKVKSFYVNGLSELIDIARADKNKPAVDELLLRAGKSLHLVEESVRVLDSSVESEIQRHLDGKATIDMWDMAGKGFAWPGYILSKANRGTPMQQKVPFHWTQEKFAGASTVGSKTWLRVAKELKIEGPADLRYQQARALRIEGNSDWTEKTWNERKGQPFAAETSFTYFSDKSEAGLSPGGAGPMYDAQQGIDGIIADRLNSEGMAKMFGKDRLTARNAQEILWALEKLDNPLKSNNDLSLYGNTFKSLQTELANLRFGNDVTKKSRAESVLAAMDRAYAQMALQEMSVGVVTNGTSDNAARIQNKIKEMKNAGDVNAVDTLIDTVADGLGDTINDLAELHGLDITVDRVNRGSRGYEEAGVSKVAPLFRLTLRGMKDHVDTLFGSLSRAMDQDGGNVMRKPTVRELNDVRVVKNTVFTFDTRHLAETARNAFFRELSGLKDGAGKSILAGFTETSDGIAIGDQFYSGDMPSELGKQSSALGAILGRYNVPQMRMDKLVIDTFARGTPEVVQKDGPAAFASALRDHVIAKIEGAAVRGTSFPQATDPAALLTGRTERGIAKLPTLNKTKGNALKVKLAADVDGAVLRGALDLDAAQAIKDLLKLAGAEETP